MTPETTCPACGSPVEIPQPGEITVCPSCGTELTVDPEGRLLPVRAAVEPEPPEEEIVPGAFQEEPFLTEPIDEPEPVEPPPGADVYGSPEVIEPGPQAPATPPSSGRRMNPWLIAVLIAVLVICIACLCLMAIVAIFFPATWDQFTGLLLPTFAALI